MDLNLVAATVNGSGSQSANLVLTRAVHAMGISVAPKNVFPSNIEGLPTWFFLRASSRGYQAGRRRANLLVALNRATFSSDLERLDRRGVVVYEQAFGAPEGDFGAAYPVPFATLAREIAPDPELRKYLVNMLYVGVVAEVLGIPDQAITAALDRQFRGKPATLAPNRRAIELGREYFRDHHSKQDELRLPASGTGDGRLLLEGNQAVALGAAMGGCTVFAWYPITPSSSVAEHLGTLSSRLRTDRETGERRIAIIQAEDELAAAGMVVGAGWMGARAMTATSGPGISLMAEFVGLAYYAEIPSVFVDIQRVGPSTGLPTRTAQGDLLFVHTLSHGDTRHPVLLPGSVDECYEMTQQALDLADRLQTPVFLLSDLDLGMNPWLTPAPRYPERPFDRGKVLDAARLQALGRFERYRDTDGDGIPWRTLPGTRHPLAAYFTRGSGHDEAARYTESEQAYPRILDRIARKLETAISLLPAPIEDAVANSETGIIGYGSSDAAIREALDLLAEAGTRPSYLRLRAVPAGSPVAEFVDRHRRVYVVEQNRDGQLLQILRAALPAELGPRMRSVLHYDGFPLFAEDVAGPILEAERALAAGAA